MATTVCALEHAKAVLATTKRRGYANRLRGYAWRGRKDVHVFRNEVADYIDGLEAALHQITMEQTARTPEQAVQYFQYLAHTALAQDE